MKKVDARGLSCPEPLMLLSDALKENQDGVEILVTEPHQKMNVEKFVKEYGKVATVSEIVDGFCIVIE